MVTFTAAMFSMCGLSGSFFVESESCYMAQTDLELVILMLEPSMCWDNRQVSPCPTSDVDSY
jgi:hypothetical protein